jgi:hypothetical protein
MFTTQVPTRPTITFPTSDNTNVNKFDTFTSVPSINIDSYIQLPSVKQDAAKLKPNAVNEKEQEIAAIVNAAKLLESEHASYVDEFVTRGNQALYAVLTKIYSLAVQINLSDNRDSIIKSLRNVMSLQKKIKTQKNSTALTLLVRWIVGGSRQLAFTYSRALDAAYKDNIAVDELAAYFTKLGGLNKVCKQDNKNEVVKNDEKLTHFNRFVKNADVHSRGYQNTKIVWTEEVYGAVTSDFSIVVAHNNGGGHFHGLRAFNVSNDAYKKICKILSDEEFKNKKTEEVEAWVKEESNKHFKIACEVDAVTRGEVLTVS